VDENSKTGRIVGALARNTRPVISDRVGVTQGQIPVESVTAVLSTSNVLVLEVDTRSEYAGHCSVGGPVDGPHAVDLTAGEYTLDSEPVSEPTVIRLPARTAGWTVVVGWRRHTIRIIAYKPEQDTVVYDVASG
jgi:hypothetical protein